jgi:subtilisin family serine protease
MLRFFRFLVAAGAIAALVAAAAPAASTTTGQYIVVLKNSVSSPAAVARDHANRFGATVNYVYTAALKGYAGTIDNSRVGAIRNDARVLFVSADRPVQADAQTLPTGIDRIDADLSPTAKIDGVDLRVNADVAILDTGVDASHPDLNVAGGFNCTPPQDDTTAFGDTFGHGTHVAGTVGALDNGFGVVGVAPGARIWAIKVLGNGGFGFFSWIVCGIDFVTAHADVFEVANMSLGGGGSDDGNCGRTNGDAMHLAICNSVAAGVTYAVAAGNSADDAANHVPAAYDEVITVSALADFDGKPGGLGSPTCRSDEDDTLANFSNFGTDIDLIAPGVCILSTLPTAGQISSRSGYGTISGTSMATPHVTGSAALYKANNPSATPAQVKAALQKLGTLNWNNVDDPDGIKERLVNVARL